MAAFGIRGGSGAERPTQGLNRTDTALRTVPPVRPAAFGVFGRAWRGYEMASESSWSDRKKWLMGIISALIVAALVGLGTRFLAPNNSVKPVVSEPLETRFDFESGVMGWYAHEGRDIRGCPSVEATAERPYSGRQSLKMAASLNAGNPAKRKCEARVKIAKSDSSGKEIPLDLEGYTVSAWFYAPRRSRGPGDAPNGVHLFVKDAHGGFLYGPWLDVVEDEWMPLLLPIEKTTELTGKVDADPNFDPTHVRILGLKFGTGKDSTAIYNGPIWLDDVDW